MEAGLSSHPASSCLEAGAGKDDPPAETGSLLLSLANCPVKRARTPNSPSLATSDPKTDPFPLHHNQEFGVYSVRSRLAVREATDLGFVSSVLASMASYGPPVYLGTPSLSFTPCLAPW